MMMLGCECLCWDRVRNYDDDDDFSEPQPFSLPSPLPDWPHGNGFAGGRICLGEIEVLHITKFERIWRHIQLAGKAQPFTFYRPLGIPDGFFSLGHYCQSNDQPLRGYVLVARDVTCESESPALKRPLDYNLVWSSDSHDECAYFWLPNPPKGYKTMGVLVTSTPNEPEVEEVRCVREDLTEACETSNLLVTMKSKSSKNPLQIWSIQPCDRGMLCKGVSVGTFVCGAYFDSEQVVENIGCLKNLDSALHAMPNLNQIHVLIEHYGPTVYFHPDETYMPSSVQWFFKNGALLYSADGKKGSTIDYEGSNLPRGGTNDGAFWIDLPTDNDAKNYLKKGNIESSELYVHVKPALGGSFTDIAMWVFCPFNGPATLKVALMNIEMSKIGEHVSDWEHFTLRINNFNGELWSMFFSQHSGGEWVNATDLEFIKENKPIVYSSKHGHASYPHPGTYLQGSSKLGIGVRNDAVRSEFVVDSSARYQVVAAEYLGHGAVKEPCWLQYMREWGPSIVYDGRSEIEKIIDMLPMFVRFSVENLIDLFPTELYGEEGPTGPKEKDNWLGDEYC